MCVVVERREATMAKRIGMIFCERIQDASCIGCAKCYKSVNENTFGTTRPGQSPQLVLKTIRTSP